MLRAGHAVWNGSLTDGSGRLTAESGVLEDTAYSFATRFGDTVGTNPEELLAAAHAACYSMALANAMTKAGQAPESVETSAQVRLEKTDGGFEITTIHLATTATAPGFDADRFRELAEATKSTCPVSKALAGPTITLDATLA